MGGWGEAAVEEVEVLLEGDFADPPFAANTSHHHMLQL